jgi:hypothetical protein
MLNAAYQKIQLLSLYPGVEQLLVQQKISGVVLSSGLT